MSSSCETFTSSCWIACYHNIVKTDLKNTHMNLYYLNNYRYYYLFSMWYVLLSMYNLILGPLIIAFAWSRSLLIFLNVWIKLYEYFINNKYTQSKNPFSFKMLSQKWVTIYSEWKKLIPSFIFTSLPFDLWKWPHH